MNGTFISVLLGADRATDLDHARILSTVLDIATTGSFELQPEILLCELCVETAGALRLLGCAALMRDPGGGLRAAGWSGPVARELAEGQVSSGKGPAVDAAHWGDMVLLREPDRSTGWFATEAARRGVRAMAALPLNDATGTTLGSLHLLADTGALTDDRLIAAGALARVAGAAIGNALACTQSAALAVQLSGALDTRIPVEQAKGRLAERHDIDLNGAYRLMRGQARRTRTPIARVAQSVLDGDGLALPTPREPADRARWVR